MGLALAVAMGMTVPVKVATTILQYGSMPLPVPSRPRLTTIAGPEITGRTSFFTVVWYGPNLFHGYPHQRPECHGYRLSRFHWHERRISTAASEGVGNGQGITTATDVFNAGGLTMEVWVKDASSSATIRAARWAWRGMYNLGVNSAGDVGFFHGDNVNDLSWTSNVARRSWTHLAVVMETRPIRPIML